MKKIILGLSLAIALVSCAKSPENQAKKVVEKYIANKIDDPKSYEPVKFGTLERCRSSYQDEEKYKKLVLEYNEMDKRVAEAYDSLKAMNQDEAIRTAIKSYNSLVAIRSSSLTQMEVYMETYEPVDFFEIKHSFIRKDKKGVLILDSCNVTLDENLNVKSVQQL